MEGASFSFIKSSSLRKKITESIEFSVLLWTASEGIETKYKDEIYRTIILYNIAIIEALLLLYTKQLKIKLPAEDCYTNSFSFPKYFQQMKDGEIVVSLRKKTEKVDSQIGLNDLIRVNKNYLGESLYKEVKSLNSIRNTFHLSKKRTNLSPSKEKSVSSFNTLLKIIEKMKKG